MRKALLPMIAALALCGAATAALIATNARAEQSARKPVMVALVAPGGMAATAPQAMTAAPQAEMAGPPPRDIAQMRAQFCKDAYARRVGEMAYFEAKLSLTSAQAPLFDRWKQATLDVARRHSDDCSRPDRRARNGRELTLPDRMARQEDRLKRRLADLQSERPALEALYNALNPAQKAELTRGVGRLLMMRGMMEQHMMAGPMGRHVMIGMMARPHGPEMQRGRMMPMGEPPAPPAPPPPAQ